MDYLMGAQPSYIPSHLSINESAMYVIVESEHEFNKIFKSIGLEELAQVQESGVMLESGDGKIKGIMDKFVKWLQDRWADIKGFFEKIFGKIQTKINNLKRNYDQKKFAKAKEMVPKLNGTDKDGKTKVFGKTYPYNFATFGNDVRKYGKAMDKLQAELIKVLDIQGSPNYRGTDNESGAIAKEMQEQEEVIMSTFYRSIGVDEDYTSDLRGQIKTDLRHGTSMVDITKDWLVKNIDNVIKMSTDITTTKKYSKDIFNTVKKNINSTISKSKGVKKDMAETGYTTWMTIMKRAITLNATVMGAVMECVNEFQSTCSSVIARLLSATNKTEKMTYSESAMLESSSYQAEIASLFNF